MRILLPAFAAALLASCAPAPMMADPASDAPESRRTLVTGAELPSSYPEALRRWQGAEDVNTWIGARFEYDFARAIRLSESQRAQAGRVPIHPPEQFFAEPTGICVDLARFAVETLRAVAPSSRPSYLMIEFDPVVISGNLLRRHWLVMFERDGKYYFFADSKRPGYLAGPYATVQQFIDQYSLYRGRRIVAYRSLDSYERKLRKQAPRAAREKRA
jgi:ABC-type amino acid transport substrate-binding protein